MTWLFRLAPMVFMLPVIVYFYFFVRRSLRFWHVDIHTRRKKILVFLICLLIGLACSSIGSIGFVFIMHVFMAAALLDLLNLIGKRISRRRQKETVWYKLYACGLLPIIVSTLIIGYGYWNMHHVVEQPYTIYTEKAIRPEGYKIAYISDVHFGLNVTPERMQQYAEQIALAEPDLILLGGDIVDEGTTREGMQQVFRILAGIPSSYGTYYVYGNHDRSRYREEPNYTEAQLQQALEQAGVCVLQEKAVQLTDDLVLVGREDVGMIRGQGSRAPSAKMLENVDKTDCIILMDHQPKDLMENQEAGVDLQLSGHTHNGQIWPAGLISEVFGFNEVTYGWENRQGMQIIVSSGFAGWGYPIRTSGQSEYVMISLQNAQ